MPSRYFVLKGLVGRAGAVRAGTLALGVALASSAAGFSPSLTALPRVARASLACAASLSCTSGAFSLLPTVEKKLASFLLRGVTADASSSCRLSSNVGESSTVETSSFTSSIDVEVTSSGRLRPARAERLVGPRLYSEVMIVLPDGFH